MDYKNIKSLEDACKVNGTNVADVLPYDPSKVLTPKQQWLNACATLEEVYTAVNKDEPVDYSNHDQEKWFPVFRSNGAGFGFSASNCRYVNTTSTVGSRLCSTSEEKADYVGEQFIDVYRVFLAHDKW